jgi:hypothetical protein
VCRRVSPGILYQRKKSSAGNRTRLLGLHPVVHSQSAYLFHSTAAIEVTYRASYQAKCSRYRSECVPLSSDTIVIHPSPHVYLSVALSCATALTLTDSGKGALSSRSRKNKEITTEIKKIAYCRSE